MFPLLRHPTVLAWGEILSDAIKKPGLSRDFVKVLLIFSLMVIALILPMKSFLFGNKPRESVVNRSDKV
jgi:hypothetical protein